MATNYDDTDSSPPPSKQTKWRRRDSRRIFQMRLQQIWLEMINLFLADTHVTLELKQDKKPEFVPIPLFCRDLS